LSVCHPISSNWRVVWEWIVVVIVVVVGVDYEGDSLGETILVVGVEVIVVGEDGVCVCEG